MDAIVELLESRGRAMDLDEIAEALDAPMDEVEANLASLMCAGKLAQTKRGRYARPEDVGLIAARIVVLRSGALVARPLSGDPDLRIDDGPGHAPMLDDIVLIRPDGQGRCQVQHIARRAHERFMAVLGRWPLVAPVDPRMPSDIALVGGPKGAGEGDLVRLRVTGWPGRGKGLRAEIERVMGDAGDIRAQLRAIAAQHELRESFPQAALDQANAIPKDIELADRADLRALTLFTIDGEDAQDFDDAVSLEPIDGGYRLGVHIADVSHYVRPGAPIDREALERGTSTYLPGLTLPMLPEALSNDLCSLKPNQDRLAMSLTMDLHGGKVTDHALAPSVIHSRDRLTYEQVNRMLAGEHSDVPEPLHAVLTDMAAVAREIRVRRRARGSIDFDMPEAAFTLDSGGRPTDVRAKSRGEAERMIEDFMLAANETIAELARTTGLPLLYRVHRSPDPERAAQLERFLRGLGIRARLGHAPQPHKYQKVLTEAEGAREAGLIKQVMLRSLRRAEYSAAPEGHFGLAARDYCHFTSPIRRYPDLVVHRMLKRMLAGELRDAARWEARMPELAARCSACEQRSALAERDADDLLKAHYMADRVGEMFDGVVTGVAAWGFYVTLENTVEGLVPVRTLRGDYQLDAERHALQGPGRRAIRLGDAVRVTVERVDTAMALIDFALVDG